MTEKEKAKDLVSKYVHLAKQSSGAIGTIYNAKKCALIAVDEILNSNPKELGNIINAIGYWIEVKNEIKKL